MSTIWDMNFRVVYPFGLSRGGRVRVKLVGDLLHIGNPQTSVLRDQKAVSLGGTPNASFGEVLRYQPPMTGRVGVEVSF